MLDALTPSQQMFMLFFSILYGIMLNSLIGLATFPIAHCLAGKDIIHRDWSGEYVYSNRKTARKRFVLSFVLLNLFPFLYFAWFFQQISFIEGVSTGFQIVIIALLSLSVFAFPQFFYFCVTCRRIRKHIYTPLIFRRIMDEKGFYPKAKYHVIAGIIYLVIPWVVFVIFSFLNRLGVVF